MSVKKWGGVGLVLAPLCLGAVETVDLSSGSLGWSRLWPVVEKGNPEIQAARAEAAMVRAREKEAWALEKPRLDFEWMNSPRGGGLLSNAQEKSTAITQEIPFPTVFWLESRRAREASAGAEAVARAMTADVRARAKKALAGWFLIHQVARLTEENTDLFRRVARAAESKYAAGPGSQSDVLKAQVELSKMLNMTEVLTREKDVQRARLNVLLNRSPETPLAPPEDLTAGPHPGGEEQWRSRALAERPERRAAAAAFAQSRTELRLAQTAYLPDFMVQYRERSMGSGMDSRDFMVGVTLPFWFWKQSGGAREARAEQERREALLRSVVNETTFEVKDAYVRVDTADRWATLYRTGLLPQAEQALRVAEAAYRSDRGEFLDVLDAARSLLEFRLDYVRSVAARYEALADLERLAGADISLEVQP